MSGEKASALTASGTKTIFVYGPELKLLGRIESWVSLVWPERYNTYKNVQGAQLELHESTSLQALCRPTGISGWQAASTSCGYAPPRPPTTALWSLPATQPTSSTSAAASRP